MPAEPAAPAPRPGSRLPRGDGSSCLADAAPPRCARDRGNDGTGACCPLAALDAPLPGLAAQDAPLPGLSPKDGALPCPRLSEPGGSGMDITLNADPQAVRRALAAVLERFGPRLSPADAGTTELVLGEVLNNITEHAYQGDGGPIRLRLCPGPACIICLVEDEGLPMPGLRLPERPPRSLAELAQSLPEGGFGWQLIRELAQGIDYRRQSGRNLLAFALRLTPQR